MNIIFKAVTLTKNDTCLTYVLKRLGFFKQEKEYSLRNFEEYFNKHKITKNTVYKPGDIIIWSKKVWEKEYPNSIDVYGVIHNTKVQRNIHVAVIEQVTQDGDIFYSECRTDKTENTGVPVLHYKQLNGSKLRKPDFILTLK